MYIVIVILFELTVTGEAHCSVLVTVAETISPLENAELTTPKEADEPVC